MNEDFWIGRITTVEIAARELDSPILPATARQEIQAARFALNRALAIIAESERRAAAKEKT